ncbi:MAG: histidine kinase, partial [Anaerolineae bacterium]|nr:histidine kinase [Anaerolineae bacterium]
DSGPGISPDVMARLFEPFYTTKENGTGLGLATSHSIIQQHGGTMTAGNAPGGGAVFTVALPMIPSDKPHLAERR